MLSNCTFFFFFSLFLFSRQMTRKKKKEKLVTPEQQLSNVYKDLGINEKYQAVVVCKNSNNNNKKNKRYRKEKEFQVYMDKKKRCGYDLIFILNTTEWKKILFFSFFNKI